MALASGLPDAVLAVGCRPVARGDQPTGGCAGELVPDAARDTRARCRGWTSRPGSRENRARWWWSPRMLTERERHRRPRRSAGSPFPGQPGREPALRAADGFSRRTRGNAARGCAPVAAGAAEDRRAEREVPRATPRDERRLRRRVLPVPSPARLESARAGMDGLRAQTGKARRPECAAARRRGRDEALRVHRRRHRSADGREIRDHARHRHRAAARRGPAIGRSDGAPVESRVLRPGAAARRRRIRHPAAPRRCEHVRIQPLAVRARLRRRVGDRSVHAHGFGRLPGRIRGRLVHRQGHL